MRLPLALLMTLTLTLPQVAVAQGSAYIPLDDPLLPLIEHLIARGELRDPSPMQRPFRRSDLRTVLIEARVSAGSPSARMVQMLASEFAERDPDPSWGATLRGGVQSFTSARRDQLQPAGPGGTRGYAELGLEARAGSLVAVTRGAAENRLKLDPDWPGDPSQDGSSIPTRFIDAYLSAQWRYVHLTFGMRERNFGPEGLPGIAVSNVGYPRSDLQFDLVTRRLRLTAIGARLRPATSLSGEPVGRYLAVHRLSVEPHPALHLAIWESAVIADRFGQIDTDFFNPLTLLSFSTRFGWGDDRNVLLGADVAWRTRGVLLEGQAALDDFNPGADNPYPNRWAFTLGASGPLGARAAWRARYTTATSLAFRTLDPVENLTDGGVGLGRNFADNEQWLLRVSVPVRNRWLVAPEAVLLRQGEGSPHDPWPTPAEADAIPTRFIGEIATTLRLGVSVSGRSGPFQLSGSGAWHRTAAADTVVGSFEVRLTATAGFRTGGRLQ